VLISARGAELQSAFNKEFQLEYIWQADPKFWGKHSPVLFPIVGTLKNNTYFLNGRSYQLDRHGFAREKEFKVESHQSDAVHFILESDEETLSRFPFHFKFTISYRVIEAQLSTSYAVLNTSNQNMFFSVGGHPAFRVPLDKGLGYDDYSLVFEKEGPSERWPISKDGLIELKPVPLLLDGRKLRLNKSLFASDALVFKHLKDQRITLLSDKSSHGLAFSFSGFPYLGIWAAKNADFVCIEPWCGIADSVNTSQELTTKEGIEQLKPGEVFLREWKIDLF
jgi:galactose mutarotase-like enzyme